MTSRPGTGLDPVLDSDFDNLSGYAGTEVDSTPVLTEWEQLWRAALVRAMTDATLPDDVCVSVLPESPKLKDRKTRNRIDRDAARAWFFGRIGVTAADFVEVCRNCGFDPEVVRVKMQELIDKRVVVAVEEEEV